MKRERARRGRVARFALAVVCTGALIVSPADAAQPDDRRAIVVVATDPVPSNLLPNGPGREPDDLLLRDLDVFENAATGLYSSMQGRFDRRQVFVDISQGSRQPGSSYRRTWGVHADGSAGNWSSVRDKARRVSTTLRPGLLGSSVPGGAALVTGEASGGPWAEGFAATDERGRVQVSSGPVETIVARVGEVLTQKRLAVVSLPPGREGYDIKSTLFRERPRSTLIVFLHVPPTPDLGLQAPTTTDRFYRLPAIGIAGLGGDGSVKSATTRRDGLVSAIDIAPTVLEHLRLPVPKAMRGAAIERGSRVSPERLELLRRRWDDRRGGAQTASFQSVVWFSAIAGMAVAALFGLRRGARAGVRIGALALMWWPTVVLALGTIAVSRRGLERFWVPAASVALAAVCDRALRWPRAAVVPAAVGAVAFTADLLLGGRLLTVSLLGPSVISGSRFYGVSNELEPLLPIMVLVALAAAGARREPRRLVPVYVACGVALALVIGAGRFGADVGGVPTTAAAFAAAIFVLRGTRVTMRSVLSAVAVAAVALLALIAFDVVTGADSHLDRNLRRAEGGDDLTELVTRRYQLANRAFRIAGRPALVVAAAVAVAAAVRNRRALYASLPEAPWRAALVGGLAAGIGGALTNDSGPVLFINAVLGLAVITGYALGAPEPAPA